MPLNGRRDVTRRMAKQQICRWRRISETSLKILAGRRTWFLAGLLALTGCASLQVAMGLRVHLDKIPISSMSLQLPNGPSIGPGEKSPLVAILTKPDGTTLRTEGKGGGQVMWKELQLTTELVSVTNGGVLSLPHDPRFSDGKIGHVTATVPGHPGLRAGLDVPVGYAHSYVCNFSGWPGSSGSSGFDGLAGASGSMGSFDPDNPSAGGDGSNGANGDDGKDGDPGGDAPAVRIQLAFRQGNPPLLQALVSASGKDRRYLINPQGGSLTVKADGGPGGSGGSGGRGGAGGSGGVGSPNGSSGIAGLDGRSGWTGRQGTGGAITIIYDPKAKPFLNAIHVSSQNGPKPVYKEQVVSPLW
jgi:hypothetical protein